MLGLLFQRNFMKNHIENISFTLPEHLSQNRTKRTSYTSFKFVVHCYLFILYQTIYIQLNHFYAIVWLNKITPSLPFYIHLR